MGMVYTYRFAIAFVDRRGLAPRYMADKKEEIKGQESQPAYVQGLLFPVSSLSNSD